MNEGMKRRLNLIFTFAAWSADVAVMLIIAIKYNHIEPYEAVPRWPGLSIIFLTGLGIVGIMVRSRYKMVDTISDVFRQGVKIGTAIGDLEKAQVVRNDAQVARDHAASDERRAIRDEARSERPTTPER